MKKLLLFSSLLFIFGCKGHDPKEIRDVTVRILYFNQTEDTIIINSVCEEDIKVLQSCQDSLPGLFTNKGKIKHASNVYDIRILD